MYFKFVNEHNVKPYNNGFIVFDGKIYTNPKEEQLKMAGYKPIVEGPRPSFDVKTQSLSVTYVENEDFISEIYTVIDGGID